MSSSDCCGGGEVSSAGLGSRYGAKDLVGRLQRLVEMPRPAEGYPLEWYIEAHYLGDVTAIATLSLRSEGTQS